MTVHTAALPLLTLRLRAHFDGPAPTALHAAELWRGAIKGALERHAPDLLGELIRPEVHAASTDSPRQYPTNQTTPGYVLRVEWNGTAPGLMPDEQHVRLTFFGRAGRMALPLLYALQQDESGSGIGSRRRHFAMQKLQAYRPERGWYDIRLPLVADAMLEHGWTHEPGPWAALKAAERINLMLRFTTSLVFEVKGTALTEVPALPHLVGSLAERCNRLAQVWNGSEAFDAAALLRLEAAASTARLEQDTALRREHHRLPSGRSRHRPGRPAGLFLYSLPAAAAIELLPLLDLGQWLHVGAHTTAGLGHYQLLVGAA
jgi:hypothetical protein